MSVKRIGKRGGTKDARRCHHMRKNPRLFTPEEYIFLHKVFLKQTNETKIFQKIKSKRGVRLDKGEIDHIKKKFNKWKETEDSTMLLPTEDFDQGSFF